MEARSTWAGVIITVTYHFQVTVETVSLVTSAQSPWKRRAESPVTLLSMASHHRAFVLHLEAAYQYKVIFIVINVA